MNDNYEINVLTFLSSRTPPVSSEAIKLFLGDKSGYAGRFRILFGVIDTYNKNTRDKTREWAYIRQPVPSLPGFDLQFKFTVLWLTWTAAVMLL